VKYCGLDLNPIDIASVSSNVTFFGTIIVIAALDIAEWEKLLFLPKKN